MPHVPYYWSTSFDNKLSWRRFPCPIVSPRTTNWIMSLCRTHGSNNLSPHHSLYLMSSPIDYIFMNSLDKCVVIINGFLSFSRISVESLMRDIILSPLMIMLTSTTFLHFRNTKLVHDLCCILNSLTSNLCYVLAWSITIFYIKNVVRISPPLKNSWYSNTSCHLHSYLGPLVPTGMPTSEQCCLDYVLLATLLLWS